MNQLASRVLDGERRAIARAISYVEDDHPEKTEMLKDLYPHTGKAYLIGITGPPGAGKSSLTDAFIWHLRQQGLRIGVVAVDPTSPFTGGALLGDRVRMQNHALDPDVFIRSMGTRGSLGGLSRTTKEAVRILDASGTDVIIIETVGVGQSELDIMNIADSIVLVLNPGGGDSVQAFKAGIMEIADLFVINKADLPGVEKLYTELEQMIDLARHDAPWRPPVVRTISVRREGMESLWEALNNHRQYLEQSGEWDKRRRDHLRQEVAEIVGYKIQQQVMQQLEQGKQYPWMEQVAERRMDPYTAAQKLIGKMMEEYEPKERRWDDDGNA
ncbi:MAG: methylmalonyl Co-A mutase-associated GTPase MeaB [Bacillaceae bacterium]|nr:methylmalonyl Co-A mutase-associated GTPase MeaB [Bacillaceae bacterium]